MSGYNGYGSGYRGGNMQPNMNNHPSNNGMMMGGNNMESMGGGQSLDDIVNQNAQVIRRQSQTQSYRNSGQSDMGGAPMMEFSGTSPTGPLDTFQFDPTTGMTGDMNNMSGSMAAQMSGLNRNPGIRRAQSGANVSQMNSPYGGAGSVYSMMTQGGSNYASPAHANNGFDMDSTSPYMANPSGMSMDFGNDGFVNMMGNDMGNDMGTNMDNTMGHNLDNGMDNNLGNDMGNMSSYTQPSPFHPSMLTSPMNMGPMSGSMSTGPNNGSGEAAMNEGRRSTYGAPEPTRHNSDESSQRTLSRSHSMQYLNQANNRNSRGQNTQPSQPQRSNSNNNSTFPAQPQNPQSGSAQDKGMGMMTNPLPDGFDPSQYNPNNQGFNWEPSKGGWPSTMVGKPHMESGYKNAYSSSGFDMLGVLMRVATRPNAEIDLGSVDLSCAFVVCDAEKDDFPIIYCSDNFERLTGYTRHMILGRNCRFLQSPDGNVAAGVKRKYVDDDSVLYLKNMVNARREAQISLINYRRGGQPFMNLLTMIPISWDTDQVKFFVGFQVDLVEQPNAVTSKNTDGSYNVNYQRGMTMPRYVLSAPESTSRTDLGQTVPRDDVSAILSTIGTGESEYAKRMWDKVLLENSDDVVHVLSLKGLFQWVSPSSFNVLEYEPGELIGTALSSVCHPSDIVPVTRELKDTSSGASVNIVFRIRRKNSGYMWFEGHGSLHTEQGKGRKSIIMVGRERPVYTLSRNDISSNGGVGEHELWTKISTSGLFLFVSSNVRQLLDRQPEELVGVSIQTLMRSDSKQDFGRILEHARTGNKASVKHEVINRRGQVLQAFTTLYPGDATMGLKPTFIIAQTRLIKYSRNNGKAGQVISDANTPDSSRPMQSLGQQIPNNPSNVTPRQGSGSATPQSGNSAQYVSTETAATTYAGQNGLKIGRQDESLASDDNLFDELKTTKSSSWQYEIRQLEKRNRLLAEEVQSLLASKKKRKRRKGAGQLQKDCANCHTRVTPEWRRGPSGQRDLCNSCGLRWAKLVCLTDTLKTTAMN